MDQPKSLDETLAGFVPRTGSGLPTQIQKAIFVARHLQQRATALQTPEERRKQRRLQRMVEAPEDKATLVRITDEAFRASDPARGVEHLTHIIKERGIPGFLSGPERLLMRAFEAGGAALPGPALEAFKRHIQRDSRGVILPGERDRLVMHLSRRAEQGVRMNVNFLGEAILSEAEAERRLQHYCTALHWPEIEVVSIKISTLFSQICSLAREHTISRLCNRLERLIRTASKSAFIRPDGSEVPKFVYLDMEEYRDKELTAEVFIRTLDRPTLMHAQAGIALQSYLPDSYETLLRIQDWARNRVAAEGGRITVRLVKGANMEMERLDAALHGWPQAPFKTKLETDANHKRMLQESLRRENLDAINVGIASHNVFDIAYGLVLAHEADALEKVQFEMLEGMANPHQRALLELTHNILLYAPACESRHFINAIGYLVRRLDENTGPENFLRHAFQMEVGSPDWLRLENEFIASFDAIEKTDSHPRRTQNRLAPRVESVAPDQEASQEFSNEPDTDFSLPANCQWAQGIIAKWHPLCGDWAPEIPLVIGGEDVSGDGEKRESFDPSRPGVVVARFTEATEREVQKAAECAAADPDGWRAKSMDARCEIMRKVAHELRKARADLIGSAIADGGKTISEADSEVSEAVDFAQFYGLSAQWWNGLASVKCRSKGVVVVVSPWNFPIAIPCGGMAAALAVGNTVILKPASDTALVAWELCKCFWRAGVSKRVLQFVPASGSKGGQALVNHPAVLSVILTGGTATALAMLGKNPRLQLFAETGGKDATIVTSLADRDQAIKHILHSAFSHSGQKCSATSLLLLQAEIYDDPEFRRSLCEATQSLAVGSAWQLETRIGPLIRKPSGDLEAALKELGPGEEWALMPHEDPGNPNLWTPGIKYGVQPGSYTHNTEFFGPVLGVMRFHTLEEAVNLVNQPGYGLTSGLESLDEREWEYWKKHIRAGNLYINRVTTGAIVLRQPFGGHGKSVFGPGMKAGGPNYVAQFMDFEDAPGAASPALPENPLIARLCRIAAETSPQDGNRLSTAALSYEKAAREEFLKQHDHFKLPGQDNFRRYLPSSAVWVRVKNGDTAFETFARLCAGLSLGIPLRLSIAPGHKHEWTDKLSALLRAESRTNQIHLVQENETEFATAISETKPERIRYAAPGRVSPDVLQAAVRAGTTILSTPVSSEGRLELLWYVREQSISVDYHRYGNLGSRAGEQRADVL